MGACGRQLVKQITAVERRVCRLLCAPDCPPVKQLPAVLGISARTINTHLEKLYRKLGVHNRAGLVLAAISLGLVACPCPHCNPPPPETPPAEPPASAPTRKRHTRRPKAQRT